VHVDCPACYANNFVICFHIVFRAPLVTKGFKELILQAEQMAAAGVLMDEDEDANNQKRAKIAWDN
jgi:hypothetical protein